MTSSIGPLVRQNFDSLALLYIACFSEGYILPFLKLNVLWLLAFVGKTIFVLIQN